MTIGSSTLRSFAGSTVTRQPEPCGPALQQAIESEWRETGNIDLVVSLQRHPSLLRDRSILLTLAVREFQTRRRLAEIDDLEQHCSRFREFGGSIHGLILRQLEVQRFIDDRFDETQFEEPRWPKVGERFGSFHVVEELGFGSMARVYLCHECDLGNREVVVKAAPHADIEASILGRLNHPNVTPVHSVGYVEESELHFLCMPYCGRSTLTDVLDLAFAGAVPSSEHIDLAATRWNRENTQIDRRGWHPILLGFANKTYVDAVLDLAIAIASALECAHRHRILHGDLKPSNVLLAPNGRPLLLDFNLSQDFAQSLRRCGGTLPYMPPEHLQLVVANETQESDVKFDPAPDIFSFGALMCELLTGTTPLTLPQSTTNTKDIASQFLEQYRRGIRLPRHPHFAISQRLEALVLKCLSFDRNQRPASIDDVKRGLSKERRWTATFLRRAKSRPIAFWSLATSALLLVISVATYVTFQPSRNERAFNAGLAAAAAGDLPKAISNFENVLHANPSFTLARFERGRAYLRSGDVGLAMQDFGNLAQDGDPKSMALLAYCYNVQHVMAAAIVWYERAIVGGAHSVAIYNNLGACYLVTQTQVNPREQLHRAEKYLRKALEEESTSVTIQLNIVRFAAIKSAVDLNYDPSVAWPQAYELMISRPEDAVIRAHLDVWYSALVRFAERYPQSDEALNRFNMDQTVWSAFKQLHREAHNRPPGYPENPSRSSGERVSMPQSRYFLEPFSLESGSSRLSD